MAAAPTRPRRMRRGSAPAAILLLVLGCGGGAERDAGDGDGTPAPPGRHVVLILLDAARADRFSCYGYERGTTPAVDRLAAAGVVFERHYAQGTDTRTSLPSLLASRYFALPLFPDNPQVPYSDPRDLFRRPDDAQVSLPRAFVEAGYLTAAVTAHLWTGEGTAFAAEFEELHDLTDRYSSQAYPYPRAEQVVDYALAWLDGHRDRDVFLYLHLMDTHYPHYFEEDAQVFFGAPRYPAAAGRFRESGQPLVEGDQLTADDRRYIDALYDGSLRYTDRHLGRLFDGLEAGGPRPSGSLVVAVTSDHGEHLLDGPDGGPRPGKAVFAHGGAWLEELARVPLVVYAPGVLDPGRYYGLTEGVDVAPTLLALAGVPPGWSRVAAGGYSALMATGDAPRLEVRFPLPDGRYLLGLGLQGRVRIQVGGEVREVAGGQRLGAFGPIDVRGRSFEAVVEPLPDAAGAGSRVALLYFGFSPLGQGEATAEDEETLRRLRALGYVD